MKVQYATDGRPMTGQQRARWSAPLFFAVWPAVVVLAVWWLVGKDSDRPDLLIALDRSDADSPLAQARRWIEPRVEVYWAYLWILPRALCQ
jgi:hypothetical protein